MFDFFSKKKFYNFAILILSVLLLNMACASKDDSEDEENIVTLLALLVASPWEQVKPSSDGNITIRNKTFRYQAKCSGHSFGGGSNSEFFYYIRRGDPKKLLINFMGGGSCFNQANCFGSNTTTYFNGLSQLSPTAMKFVFGGGIFDNSKTTNPFSSYTVIFIPYCTGDLHWGSNDVVYSPTSNNFTGNTNPGGTFSHRGFDNTLSVLKDLQTSYPSPEKVFITGQSAGGYGAIFNSPYIIEAMGGLGSTTDYAVVSDAAAGVTIANNNNFINSLWGVTAAFSKAGGGVFSNLPDWIPGINDGVFNNLQLGDLVKSIAQAYPNVRFGQYTSALDTTQAFFLNVTRIVRDQPVSYTNETTSSGGSDCSVLWGNANGLSGGDFAGCSSNATAPLISLWRNGGTDPKNGSTVIGMISQIVNLPVGVNNYSYYIAPGPSHTITMSSNFYSTSTNNRSLLDWYSAIANKQQPSSVQCNGESCLCGSGTDSNKCATANSL
ncbi:pectin acetylesterase-family hydrolase [Leptospira sp. GIMC2001]|uniref:pectin acetylesterase-family hydrolase n=1 Tax=Leptospira sp. GIMC2001 TaxID=1513297 RepID=UPI00234B7420|nr:pectin acetylesterase-family hydrolase [Leptospira sp. GIMC2001]WCL49155.1 pectin acetylesterase-family hydrolase [Leptospira sp. GIMC2001]